MEVQIEIVEPVHRFILEMCDLAPDRSVWKNSLYVAWQQWRKKNGVGTTTTMEQWEDSFVGGTVNLHSARREKFYVGIALKLDRSTSPPPTVIISSR